MEANKATSLLGFAVKANKLIYGTDRIMEKRKKTFLVIICRTLSENSRKKLLAQADTIVIETVKKDLSEILHKENCKAAALIDRQMADAVLKNIKDDYRKISEVR